MNEILPDILGWPWFSQQKGYDFNGWLVRHEGGNVVVDPVEPTPEVLATLVREGVFRIVLTNRNHGRASARVREATGARIAIHPADAPHARSQGVPVDEDLAHGARVGPFVVVPAPGKSPGEVVLHWPERRILVVGDVCVGHPAGSLSLLPDKVMDDPTGLRRTLTRLADELDFDSILTGDGAPILAGGREALRRLVASFE